MEPKSTNNANQIKAKLNSFQLGKKPALIIVVVFLAVVAGGLFYNFNNDRTETNQDQTSQVNLKKYSDSTFAFSYPENWSVEAQNNLEKYGSYNLKIRSPLTDGTFSTGGQPTKFQLSATLTVRKNEIPAAICQQCEVLLSQQVPIFRPASEYWMIFGKDNAEIRSPIQMNLNSKELKKGTENYQSFASLDNGKIFLSSAYIEHQTDDGRMVKINNLQNFQGSSVYNDFVKLLFTLEIK